MFNVCRVASHRLLRAPRHFVGLRLARAPTMAVLTGTLLSGCVLTTDPNTASGLPAFTATEPIDSTAPAGQAQPNAIPGATAADLDDGRLTPFELQTEVMSFADRYIEAVAEASDWAAADAGDGELHPDFHNVKVVYAMAAVEVATLPDPLHALRDFIVMVELQKSVWAEPGPSWAPPAGRARIQRALQGIETQLLALAKRVMPVH